MGIISHLPKWQQQLIEQPLHFLAGAAIAALLVCMYPGDGAIGAGVISITFSSAVGIGREIMQLPMRRPWDTVLDLVFWAMGAVAGALTPLNLGLMGVFA